MAGSNETVREIDFIEGTIYAQLLTGVAYLGWNDNVNGISIGIFHQVSAGVAAYTSGGGVISPSVSISCVMLRLV